MFLRMAPPFLLFLSKNRNTATNIISKQDLEVASNTVLQAVSGNSRDGTCFKLDKQTWRRKSNGTQKTISQIHSLKFCNIWQNFYFYRILNNENFKMEVEQMNFVAHLIITVQLYYWLSKNPSVKIWSNKFQMVMINYSELCSSL